MSDYDEDFGPYPIIKGTDGCGCSSCLIVLVVIIILFKVIAFFGSL